MPRKTTKKIDGAEKALSKLSNKRVNEINEALINGNRSELVDFVMRLCVSKDFPLMMKLLASLQDNTPFLKKETEWDTLYNVGMRDGKTWLIRDFTEICIQASEGNRDFVESKLHPVIIK